MTLSLSCVTVFSEPTSSERSQELESQKFGSSTDIDSLGENHQQNSNGESEYVFLGKFLFLIRNGGGSGRFLFRGQQAVLQGVSEKMKSNNNSRS